MMRVAAAARCFGGDEAPLDGAVSLGNPGRKTVVVVVVISVVVRCMYSRLDVQEECGRSSLFAPNGNDTANTRAWEHVKR